MAILKIARMGHPVLQVPASAVADPTDEEIARIVQSMVETMEDAGGVGLAAPQVYLPLRIIIFRVPTSRSGNAEVPLTVLINPEIEPVGDERVDGVEACLSIPGLAGVVPRWNVVQYRGFGLSGEKVECIANGFHSRVVQHEVDHLDGILYPMRMKNMATFGFVEELKKSASPVGGRLQSGGGDGQKLS